MFKSRLFDGCLEKATSHLLLEPDWDATLQLCDAIRQGDVSPKDALKGIKKKISNDNPHVSTFALQVLESAVKNCGSIIQSEIASKEFMEFMKEVAKTRADPVKGKVLELIQVWSHAFRNIPTYRSVTDMYHLMKAEDFQFPLLKESDAMFSAEKAPEWKDGECCHRCRVTFTVTLRKHHCRNCGQIFCGKCASKYSIIPKFGIEKEVRVCDGCHDLLVKPSSNSSGKTKSSDEETMLPAEYLSSSLAQQAQVSQSQTPAKKSEQELREEEELQLALALSQSEAESKAKEHRDRGGRSYGSSYGSSSMTRNDTNSSDSSLNSTANMPPVIDTSDMDPELARYLNRNYWEKKKEKNDVAGVTTTTATATTTSTTTTPSAPVAQTEPKFTVNNNKAHEVYQNGENDSQEQFLNALKSSVEIFVNRMKSNSLRGRSIANDSSVQTLFMTINQMHPELTKYLQEQEDARAHYEGLQDKLAQLKDAREALDALRTDHLEKRRREAEEAERLRQIQMAQKLEVMRQKKQEYLEYQRLLAQQRLAEQERELQQRLEQQKQLAHMRHMQQYGFPQQQQMYAPQPGQTFSPGGSQEASPIHRYNQPPSGGMYGQPPPGMMPPPQSLPPGQPMYQGYAGQPLPGQPQSLPPSYYQTGYQPPVTGYQPTYSGVSGQQSVQYAGMQGQQGMYGPPGQEQPYQSYDIQGMASSLPQQQPGMMPPGQQPQVPIAQAGYPGPQTAYQPPPGQQQQQQYQEPDPHAQGPDPLISFD